MNDFPAPTHLTVSHVDPSSELALAYNAAHTERVVRRLLALLYSQGEGNDDTVSLPTRAA